MERLVHLLRNAKSVPSAAGLENRIIFTRHGHHDNGDRGMFGKFYRDFVRVGEPDSEILPTLAPIKGERVVWKDTYDAFLGTPLDSILRSAGVEQVIIAGALTHLCCETTARSAFCRGYEVYFAIDATVSRTEALHLGALRGLADGFAVLMTTAQIVKAFHDNT